MSHDVFTAIVGVAAATIGASAKGLWAFLRLRSSSAATVQAARIDDAAEMRRELWAEVDKLRDRIDDLQKDLDQSRRAFLDLLEEHTALKGEYRSLKHEHDQLLIRYSGLEARLDNV